MKTCTKCNIKKPLNEYYVDKSKLSGYCSQCKSCHQYYKKLGHKQHKGVYGIFSTNECLYVGESEELRNRIWAHNSNLKNITTNIKAQQQLYINIAKHNDIIIKILEECDNHKERELYWINKLKPKYQ